MTNETGKSDSKKPVFTPVVIVGILSVAAVLSAAFALASQSFITQTQKMSDVANSMQNIKSAVVNEINEIPQTDDSVLQIGNELLFLESNPEITQTPNEVSEGVRVSNLCDSQINASIANYRTQQRIAAAQKETASRAGMVGRLIIPSAGIDVALINGPASYGLPTLQAITDAPDSCAYITGSIPGATLLADHNNQGFRGLTSVRVGTTGMIVTATDVINIVATTVFNGHNTGHLTDGNMVPLGAVAPYIAYTCLDNSFNIRIVGFSIQ